MERDQKAKEARRKAEKAIQKQLKQATPQERKGIVKDLKEGERVITPQVVQAVQKVVEQKTGASVTKKEAAAIAVIEVDLQQDKLIVQAKKAEITAKSKQKKKAAQVAKLKQDVKRIETGHGKESRESSEDCSQSQAQS